MEIFNASDAKREFGELLLKAQRAPIGINKNGKPIAVVMSAIDYQQFEAVREERLREAIMEGIDDLKAGKVVDGDIVLDRLRKRIT